MVKKKTNKANKKKKQEQSLLPGGGEVEDDGEDAEELEIDKEEKEDADTATIDIKHLECPISYELMTDPVILEDGSTYQRAAIQNYINEERRKEKSQIVSPMSQQPLSEPIVMMPNQVMKCLVLEFMLK